MIASYNDLLLSASHLHLTKNWDYWDRTENRNMILRVHYTEISLFLSMRTFILIDIFQGMV